MWQSTTDNLVKADTSLPPADTGCCLLFLHNTYIWGDQLPRLSGNMRFPGMWDFQCPNWESPVKPTHRVIGAGESLFPG